MKKQFLLLGAILFGVSALAQQAPTNTAPGGSGPSGQNSAQYWSRAGNNNFPVGNTNNIFGTLWNSPIYTVTNGVNRTKLNGNVNYNVNGFTQGRDGYLLLGKDGPLLSGDGNIYTDKGAFSLLHLNGVGSQVQELGYRSWMQTSITFTGNRDLSYFNSLQSSFSACK